MHSDSSESCYTRLRQERRAQCRFGDDTGDAVFDLSHESTSIRKVKGKRCLPYYDNRDDGEDG